MRFTRDRWPQIGNCFVMMPFGEQRLGDGQIFNWDSHYQEVIRPVIRETGMTPLRADQIYGAEPHLNRLWRGIQEAEVIVADVTGRNSDVFYELALAQAFGKRILILTMNPDDVPVDLGESVPIRYSKEGTGLLRLTRDLRQHIEAARKKPTSEAMLTPPSVIA
jgi:small subunit ribosomal protein S1